jgi:hypothetical protein
LGTPEAGAGAMTDSSMSETTNSGHQAWSSRSSLPDGHKLAMLMQAEQYIIALSKKETDANKW